MATVQFRGKYWAAKWRDSHGKQRCVSTKLTNEKAAQKLADEWAAASRSDAAPKQQFKFYNDMMEGQGGVHFRGSIRERLVCREDRFLEIRHAGVLPDFGEQVLGLFGFANLRTDGEDI
jgi:hypothetical protein